MAKSLVHYAQHRAIRAVDIGFRKLLLASHVSIPKQLSQLIILLLFTKELVNILGVLEGYFLYF